MANKIEIQVEAVVRWLVSGGDETIDLGQATAGAVEVGSYRDWGAAPRPAWYYWWLDIDGFDTAPVVGETVNLYVTESEDSTLWTGPESPSDTGRGTGVLERLPNLRPLGNARVWSTTAGNNLTKAGVAFIPGRYFAPVVHNATADNLLSTGDAHEVRFYPIPDEIQ